MSLNQRVIADSALVHQVLLNSATYPSKHFGQVTTSAFIRTNPVLRSTDSGLTGDAKQNAKSRPFLGAY
jgi:hypothetical protein